MQFSYHDISAVTPTKIASGVRALSNYRAHVSQVVTTQDVSAPEYSLGHVAQQQLHDQIDALKKQFKGISHLILVGIGGSNLGTVAVHEALGEQAVSLHTLDTIVPYQIEAVLKKLRTVRSVKKIAICVISKSGGTSETLVNASVLLEALEKRYKKAVYKQTVFIGDAGTPFMKAGKRLGVTCVAMPKIVGGRYSVTTEVGLVPLALLGHDTDSFIEGVLDATSHEYESTVAESAVRLSIYLKHNYQHYNFFAFEPRLRSLGAWYRQLQAESLGKAKTKTGKKVKSAFVPSVSTAVELHSIGQLYMSGVNHVYTDFVTFDDDETDFDVSRTGIAKQFGSFTAQEVATGMYGGVMQAYQELGLSYRSTIFDESLPYSLGVFMGMRMLETMYVAHLLDINAFDQPNVELYKQNTKKILGI